MKLRNKSKLCETQTRQKPILEVLDLFQILHKYLQGICKVFYRSDLLCLFKAWFFPYVRCSDGFVHLYFSLRDINMTLWALYSPEHVKWQGRGRVLNRVQGTEHGICATGIRAGIV